MNINLWVLTSHYKGCVWHDATSPMKKQFICVFVHKIIVSSDTSMLWKRYELLVFHLVTHSHNTSWMEQIMSTSRFQTPGLEDNWGSDTTTIKKYMFHIWVHTSVYEGKKHTWVARAFDFRSTMFTLCFGLYRET